MEDENGVLIPDLNAPPTNSAARNGKQLKDDKKSKDKNQRKRQENLAPYFLKITASLRINVFVPENLL